MSITTFIKGFQAYSCRTLINCQIYNYNPFGCSITGELAQQMHG